MSLVSRDQLGERYRSDLLTAISHNAKIGDLKPHIEKLTPYEVIVFYHTFKTTYSMLIAAKGSAIPKKEIARISQQDCEKASVKVTETDIYLVLNFMNKFGIFCYV